MTYAKKTCYDCGQRDIQPNMKRVTITKTNTSHGYSHKTKKATSSRAYVNKRKVFVCKSCADARTKSTINTWLFLIATGIVIYFYFS